ncbi:MAG TPA: phosphatase PAP2 family protein [Jatrophihabitans sp.]|jgi:undecaprenyl-diphosphatase
MMRRGPDREHARRRFEGRALLAFVSAFAAAVMFAVLTLLVTSRFTPLLRLDRDTATELHEFALRHKGFTAAMKVISNVGSPTSWWLIFVPVVLWLVYRRLYRLATFVAVTAIGSSPLNNLIKLTVNRARPSFVDPVAAAAGKSFPSGHAQAAIVACGILLVVFLPAIARRWRRWAILVAALIVLLIGFSRIALGVHYLSDVVGAYLVGTVWLIGMVAAFRAWRAGQGKPVGELSDVISDGLEPEQGDRLAP